MGNEAAIGGIIESAMKQLKEVAGSDTIMGAPVSLGDGITVIPVSKVSFGFGGGGSDFGKVTSEKFGVGTGGGVTLAPVAVLVKDKDGVKLLQLVDSKSSAVDNLIRTAPEVFDKLTALFKKEEKEDKERA